MKPPYVPAFETDETLYRIGTIHEDNSISLDMLRRNQFPPHVVNSEFNTWLNRGYIKNFNCFYTGVHCWHGVGVDRHVADEKMKFRLTKEHLCSIKVGRLLGENPHKPCNVTAVASYFNFKFGHMPLALKLWLKKRLQSHDYSKSDLSASNARVILELIIQEVNRLIFEGRYPWQPHTYTLASSQKTAQAIFHEMIQTDKEFLSLHGSRESHQWLKEYKPDWIEKFITT